MKRLCFGLMVALVSCGDAADTVKDYISGTYVRFAAGEYSKAWDTLFIEAYAPSQGTYVVEQHTGFQRVVAGKLQPKEYQRRRSTAVLDAPTHQLQDRKSGKYYTFSPERGTVLAGSAVYFKIN